jgi:hypothetical protein
MAKLIFYIYVAARNTHLYQDKCDYYLHYSKALLTYHPFVGRSTVTNEETHLNEEQIPNEHVSLWDMGK